MSEMIERGATAMYQNAILVKDGKPVPYLKFNQMNEAQRELARGMAKAAISGLLAPTDAMIVAGDEAVIAALNEYPLDIKFEKGTPAERCWRAMISEALK